MNSKPSQRVFVGIKVSNEIAEACAKLQAEFGDLPARLIPPEDIHLTLLPPWKMTDQSFVEDALRQAIRSIKRFTLKFKHLAYGPDNMHPRLIWIECEASDELVKLEKEILKAFGKTEDGPFFPHVTIARLADKDMDVIGLRPIERPLALSMPVESIELFASPQGGETGYRALISLPIPL